MKSFSCWLFFVIFKLNAVIHKSIMGSIKKEFSKLINLKKLSLNSIFVAFKSVWHKDVSVYFSAVNSSLM